MGWITEIKCNPNWSLERMCKNNSHLKVSELMDSYLMLKDDKYTEKDQEFAKKNGCNLKEYIHLRNKRMKD